MEQEKIAAPMFDPKPYIESATKHVGKWFEGVDKNKVLETLGKGFDAVTSFNKKKTGFVKGVVAGGALVGGGVALGKHVSKDKDNDMSKASMVMDKVAGELGATVGGYILPGVGASVGAGKGHRTRAAVGSLAGGSVGMAIGSILGKRGAGLGALVGGAVGGNLGYRSKQKALIDRFGTEGYRAKFPGQATKIKDYVKEYKQDFGKGE